MALERRELTTLIRDANAFMVDEGSAAGYDAYQTAFAGPNGLEDYLALFITPILDVADIQPGHVVVDVGCGTGLSTEEVYKRGASRIVGIDPSEMMLRYARERFRDRPNVEFHEGRGYNITEIVQGQPDRVISCSSLYYSTHPNIAVAEVCRMLPSGGRYGFNILLEEGNQDAITRRVFEAFGVSGAFMSMGTGRKQRVITVPEGVRVIHYQEAEFRYGRHQCGVMMDRMGLIEGDSARKREEEKEYRLTAMRIPEEGYLGHRQAFVCLEKQ